jgi:hypothetical protein
MVMKRIVSRILLLVLFLLLSACEDSAQSVNKTVYIELPGSHFRSYAYAIGTVTEEKNGQYKIRIDEINAQPDSDNSLLNEMRLGRFVQLPRDKVLEGDTAQTIIKKTTEQVSALEQLVQNVLSLNQLDAGVLKTLQGADASGENQAEINCSLDLASSLAVTPLYRDNQLQLDTAAQAIEHNTQILEQYDRLQSARKALRNAGNPDACVSMAVRMLRETDFDLRNYVASLRGGDTEQLQKQMGPVIAINQALLDFQTKHFTDIPNGLDKDSYTREKLASLTSDLRRYYAYNYFRDYRQDLESFKQTEDVIDRFQKDRESSQVLAELLGGEILTERTLNEKYLNYYKLNKQVPVEMSKGLDDNDFFERASEGFTVVNPTNQQRLMGVEQYIQAYPEGRHIEEAKALRDELKSKLNESLPDPVLPEVQKPQAPEEIPSQLPPANPE